MSEICINPQCLVDDAPWLGDTKHGDDAFSYKETGKPPPPPNQKRPCKTGVRTNCPLKLVHRFLILSQYLIYASSVKPRWRINLGVFSSHTQKIVRNSGKSSKFCVNLQFSGLCIQNFENK